MEPLSPAVRRELRAKAHHLEPVVTVGQHGLTPQVLHEIDLALLAHELVKVKVLGDDRAAREAMLADAAAALACAPVQHVGKVLVLWRPNPEKKKKQGAARPAAATPRAAKKAPADAVRVRRRATQSAWGAAPPATGKGRRGAARHDAAPSGAPAETTRRRRPRGA